MMTGNIFARLNQEYYHLTVAEKKVADYVSVHQRKTQFMSITELAEAVGVAEATISRFCRRLGYKGYSAFKLSVADSTANQAAINNPLAGEVLPEDSVSDMCQKVYTADVNALRETLNLVEPEKISLAADLLEQAGRVLCMGQGGSMILAQEAAHLFSTAMPNFTAIWDSHMQIIHATQLMANDVVLYFSYSGSTRELLECAPIIRERGGKLILVTRFPCSPGAAYADVILQCGSHEGPLQLGSVAARLAQLYMMDVLFSEVCRRNINGCRTHREQIASALVQKHLT